MILGSISKIRRKRNFDKIIFTDFTAAGNPKNHTFLVTEQLRRSKIRFLRILDISPRIKYANY